MSFFIERSEKKRPAKKKKRTLEYFEHRLKIALNTLEPLTQLRKSDGTPSFQKLQHMALKRFFTLVFEGTARSTAAAIAATGMFAEPCLPGSGRSRKVES